MLSEEAYMSLTNAQTWEIYKQLYKKRDKKKNLLTMMLPWFKTSYQVKSVGTQRHCQQH